MEHEVDHATNTCLLVDHYIRVMQPIVPHHRLALEFKTPPERMFDFRIYDVLTSLAKRYRLHRKVKHAQAGVEVHFGCHIMQTHDLIGPFPKFYVHGGYHDVVKRMSIILLFSIVFCIVYLRS